MSDDKEDTNDQRMEGNGRLPTSAQIPTTKRMSRSVTASSRQSATTKKKRVVVPNSNTQFAAADGCDNADATNSDDDNSVQRLLLQRRMLSLVGCRLVRRWIDQQDRPRCIFGTITDCLPSSEKEAMMLTMRDFQYRVNYDTLKEFHEETKETTNVFDRDTSSCQDRSMCLDLPQSELLDMEHAWSGCWDYLDWDDNKCQSHTFLHVQNSTNMSEMENDVDEVDTFSLPTSRTVSAVQQRTILTNHSPPRWSLLFWKIPQSMHRQMRSLSTSGATDLTGPKQTSQSPVMVPNVTITYQDFHLDLKVQPSSLDSRHAGLGVFLRCSTITSCNGTCIEPVLELATGELLDIGIYAPFRSQDIQVVADFNEKDARLGGKCLEYVNRISVVEKSDELTFNFLSLLFCSTVSHIIYSH